jgi:hypothetical protein
MILKKLSRILSKVQIDIALVQISPSTLRHKPLAKTGQQKMVRINTRSGVKSSSSLMVRFLARTNTPPQDRVSVDIV